MTIDEQGYMILPNLLSEEDINYGLSCMKDGKIDYYIIKNFIDTIFLKKICNNSLSRMKVCFCLTTITND
jgi:hypothetical protein